MKRTCGAKEDEKELLRKTRVELQVVPRNTPSTRPAPYAVLTFLAQLLVYEPEL